MWYFKTANYQPYDLRVLLAMHEHVVPLSADQSSHACQPKLKSRLCSGAYRI
jgi:hypothetical protein